MKKLIIFYLFGVTLFSLQNVQAQWRKLTSNTTDNLYNIQFINAKTGYAVGWNNAGSFLKTTDAGANWKVTVVPSTYLFGVDFIDSLRGYVAGYNDNCGCGLLKTTQDGGKSWANRNFPESFGFYQVIMLDANTGYMCGYNGKILYTHDGWSTHDTGTVGNINAVFRFMYFANGDTGYAAAGNDFSFISMLYRTVDGGKNWSLLKDFQKSFSIAGMYFKNGGIGFLVGNNGTDVIMKTTDGGVTWTKKYSSGNSQTLVTSIDFKGNAGYASTSVGGILKTIDIGESWSTESSPSRLYISQVSTVDSSLAYAAGFNGSIMKRSSRFSIDEEQNQNSSLMQVYPNPVSSTGYVKVYQPESKYADIRMYNTEGRLIKIFFTGSLEAGEHTLSFDKGECAPGVYILDWYTKSEMHVNKLIITN